MNTGRNSKQTTCLCRDTGGKGTLPAQRTGFNTLDNWGHKTPTQSKRKRTGKKRLKGHGPEHVYNTLCYNYYQVQSKQTCIATLWSNLWNSCGILDVGAVVSALGVIQEGATSEHTPWRADRTVLALGVVRVSTIDELCSLNAFLAECIMREVSCRQSRKAVIILAEISLSILAMNTRIIMEIYFWYFT